MPPDPLATYALRDARPDDLDRLRDIERAAGLCFRVIGMPAVADDEPLPVQTLAEYQRAGRARVVVDLTDLPDRIDRIDRIDRTDLPAPADLAVAYLLVDHLDGSDHVEQVSVHPDHARRGLGRRLLDDAASRAAARGVPALTLTTFRDVPWNAPYYARLGFRVVDEADWTPQLRAVRAAEAAHGLDRWPRVVMRRDLTVR